MIFNFLVVLGENCPACFHFEKTFKEDIKQNIKKYKNFLEYSEIKTSMDKKNVEKNLDKLNPKLKEIIRGFPSIFIYNDKVVYSYDFNKNGMELNNIDKWILEIKNKLFTDNGKNFTVIFLTAEKCPACENYIKTKKIDEHIEYVKSKKINYKYIESVNLIVNYLLREIQRETNEDKKKELEQTFKPYAEKLKTEQELFNKIHKDLKKFTIFFPCVIIFKNSDLNDKNKILNGIMCGYKYQNNELIRDDRYNMNNFEEWIDYCIDNFEIYLESLEVMNDFQNYFRTTRRLEDLKIYKNIGMIKKKLNYFSKKLY